MCVCVCVFVWWGTDDHGMMVAGDLRLHSPLMMRFPVPRPLRGHPVRPSVPHDDGAHELLDSLCHRHGHNLTCLTMLANHDLFVHGVIGTGLVGVSGGWYGISRG